MVYFLDSRVWNWSRFRTCTWWRWIRPVGTRLCTCTKLACRVRSAALSPCRAAVFSVAICNELSNSITVHSFGHSFIYSLTYSTKSRLQLALAALLDRSDRQFGQKLAPFSFEWELRRCQLLRFIDQYPISLVINSFRSFVAFAMGLNRNRVGNRRHVHSNRSCSVASLLTS